MDSAQMKAIQLRDYQARSLDALRDGIRAGLNRQLLMAATGAGKTVCAAQLMESASSKKRRAVFLVDRVSLVDQTSRVFDEYGIAHGVIQANHWRYRPYEYIQVASVQTLSRRGFPEDIDLLVIDEAHTIHKSTINYVLGNPDLRVVGLSATPFTKGLGKVFQNLVNVTTTNRLVAEGFLAPVRYYVAKEIDMTGAKTVAGEWADSEVESRGIRIVGDIVATWVEKTRQHFGRPVKTIAFGATVAHCEEIAAAFQQAGYNFRVVSYRDGNDDGRRALIEEFRKPDSDIIGLVSCDALSKGFDVPDVLCGIGARPLRKSLSTHIQQIGRVMRIHPDKEYAVWLDHAGNVLRFHEDMEDVFQNGLSGFDSKNLDQRVRKEPTARERELRTCPRCKQYMPPKQYTCLSCGFEMPRKQSGIENVAGEMVELGTRTKGKAKNGWMADKDSAWRMIIGEALIRKAPDYLGFGKASPDDIKKAEKFALAQYRSIYGEWPYRAMRNVEPIMPTPEVRKYIKSRCIAFSLRRAA